MWFRTSRHACSSVPSNGLPPGPAVWSQAFVSAGDWKHRGRKATEPSSGGHHATSLPVLSVFPSRTKTRILRLGKKKRLTVQREGINPPQQSLFPSIFCYLCSKTKLYQARRRRAHAKSVSRNGALARGLFLILFLQFCVGKRYCINAPRRMEAFTIPWKAVCKEGEQSPESGWSWCAWCYWKPLPG